MQKNLKKSNNVTRGFCIMTNRLAERSIDYSDRDHAIHEYKNT